MFVRSVRRVTSIYSQKQANHNPLSLLRHHFPSAQSYCKVLLEIPWFKISAMVGKLSQEKLSNFTF